MKNWREKMDKALQISGKSVRTREGYIRSVRMLGEFYRIEPGEIREEQLQDYFVHRKNVDRWAPNTLRIAYCGIKFFYLHVVQADWHLLSILKAEREKRLPVIMSREETWRVLRRVKQLYNRAFLQTVYTCGLRLGEALSLEVTDIDSERMLVHVRRGKGSRDRYVPLPESTLILLRQYWRTHRNPRLLFAARGRSGNEAPHSEVPASRTTVQGALRRAVRASGINKKRISVHTLRHCYATHLLEAGVPLPVIQRYMGHRQIASTMIYVHLTAKGWDDASEVINNLMKGENNE